jgi:hypothetical protein
VVNFLTLLIGLVIGAALRPKLDVIVHAQNLGPPPAEQRIEKITPVATIGSIGTNLLLAHQMQSDSLVVNGYDLLKLDQNLLNYLASHATPDRAALQSVVNDARPASIYTVAHPEQPKK